MKHLALLVLTCSLTLGACKSESATQPTPGAAASAAPGDVAKSPARSGKIELPTRRNHPRDDDGDVKPDGAAADDERPRDLDPVQREAMKQKFDEMRKEREAKLDADGDGKISETERDTARHARAVEMRTKLDADGDGKVTTQELAASGRMARRFGDTAALDTNKDGDVSTDELEAAMKARPLGAFAHRPERIRNGGSGSAE
ncbi:MAG: hypothetical protein NT062_16165 [Proteobacteria bacterium]|nr:hypothetical protein [Pseudomonadota bacterium]